MQKAIPFVLHLTPGTLAANQDDLDVSPKPRRGRPLTITSNPNANMIRMAITNDMAFIDDAVMAGLYIAVGDSNGRLNVRPRHVRKAICLALISTADLRARFINNHGEPICKRTAEYLAAAARVALGGIGRHLARNPALGKRLQAQWDRYQQNGDEWDYTLDSDMLTDLNWYEWNAA
ncbi:hypothetical protein OX90_11450 [Pseudomonas coronafaciens pv. porri]|uniref:Uncharacterized protein n=4 Tax=Pseudomonas syringae group TaxID=136849 RepID=A0AAD0GP92_9PSED|nr:MULTISPECIES: hypothetical protein [Pseudomonas syringae group]AVB21093.1 hypothetical protein BKM03_19110 [Pseudomonas avellanae]EGH14197.1 hypothetical protein PSYMP_26973 [Pseudomonas amygdali pv. morsprunorum str. M302280]KOP51114.1 hypothetical protein OX88_26295 [Pseudomonas coronafaciens pv. porri]KOP59426.1 hypothetical protein OX90_11450 [Pseudomonas coronafaciens pv. porri]KPY21931.1 hypothetical protein ALO89_101559 [Pseudomonas coronafaciens pv. porri]